MNMKKILPFISLILVFFACFFISASAEDIPRPENAVCYTANSGDANTVIRPQTALDGEYYIFLPSSADLTKLSLSADESVTSIKLSADSEITVSPDGTFDLLSLFKNAADGEYPVFVSVITESGESEAVKITFMKSSGIRSMYIVSSDPENHGRSWVDTSKSNKATGNISIMNDKGETDYSDELTELKARGNSTFTDFVKKAYQIKIKNKTALIKGSTDKNKKWVLLANAADITLIHNSITFALAKELGVPYTHDYEPVDLYYDGEYRGSYLLTEKTEVSSSRVDIEDLDELVEAANAGTDAYENPVVLTKTRKSGGEDDAKADSKGSFKYVDGLKEPELGEGMTHHAFLLELDFIYRYPDEQSGFVTDRGQAVVTKNPEYLTKETGLYISRYFQDFEDAVFSPNGYNAATGKYYYEYCDLESLVNIYLINEYAKNYDSFRSSAFFYMPEDEDIMYAGPVWDFDICYGTGYNGNRLVAANPENFFAATKYMLSTLITIESFRDAVKEALDPVNGRFYKAAAALLGDDGIIKQYSDEVYDSQRMNYKLWNIKDKVITALFCDDEVTYENSIKFLEFFAENRIKWLSEITSGWSGSSYSAPVDPSVPIAYRFHTGMQSHPELAPTCTQDGHSKSIECTVCGGIFYAQKTIPAKGHSWIEADCGTPKTCKVCGQTEGDPLGHDYKKDLNDSRNSDTCIVYKCTRCGNTLLVRVAPPKPIILGDVNADGEVTAADARLALRISANLERANSNILKRADMDSDKKITAADARAILRKSAGL